MKARKTLQQMGQSDSHDPWECSRCGCRGPHRVESTYTVAAGVRRRRICRNCGQTLFRTTEVVTPKGTHVRVVSPDDEPERAMAVA